MQLMDGPVRPSRGKPVTSVAFSGRCSDSLPALGFQSWPAATALLSRGRKYDCSLIFLSSAQLLRRDFLRERDREPSFKGAESRCLFLTEESRYALLVSRPRYRLGYVMVKLTTPGFSSGIAGC